MLEGIHRRIFNSIEEYQDKKCNNDTSKNNSQTNWIAKKNVKPTNHLKEINYNGGIPPISNNKTTNRSLISIYYPEYTIQVPQVPLNAYKWDDGLRSKFNKSDFRSVQSEHNSFGEYLQNETIREKEIPTSHFDGYKNGEKLSGYSFFKTWDSERSCWKIKQRNANHIRPNGLNKLDRNDTPDDEEIQRTTWWDGLECCNNPVYPEDRDDQLHRECHIENPNHCIYQMI